MHLMLPASTQRVDLMRQQFQLVGNIQKQSRILRIPLPRQSFPFVRSRFTLIQRNVFEQERPVLAVGNAFQTIQQLYELLRIMRTKAIRPIKTVKTTKIRNYADSTPLVFSLEISDFPSSRW